MRGRGLFATLVRLVAPSALVVLGALVGCYEASPSPGAPCGPGGACPSGLTCVDDVCLRPGTQADAAVQGPDAPAADGAIATAWAAPVALSTGVPDESDPSMTQDRLTIVFMSEADEDLYIATRPTPTGALTATRLAVVSSVLFRDKSPEISPDGKTIYFASDRGGDFDVYRSTFTTAWSSPVRVDELSTEGHEGDLAIAPDGLTAVVIDDANPNRFLVHTRTSTAQPFGVGVFRPELSMMGDAAAPTITNGAATIYFHAGLLGDLYRATRNGDGTYTTPVRVAELSSGLRDAAPFVLQDDKHLIFERATDLYETSRP